MLVEVTLLRLGPFSRLFYWRRVIVGAATTTAFHMESVTQNVDEHLCFLFTSIYGVVCIAKHLMSVWNQGIYWTNTDVPPGSLLKPGSAVTAPGVFCATG